ncbi:MAG: hypothetical protein UT24_C0053G0011, partial [Candidatus Woesebacteria bacterium GW2011_GWB1_39_12]
TTIHNKYVVPELKHANKNPVISELSNVNS